MITNLNLLLRTKFETLRSSNPSYSLRAFSKRLNVHPAAMSEIIRGKRVISHRLGNRILTSPIFTEVERAAILKKIKQHKKLSDLDHLKSKQSTQLDLDKYFIVSEWYYYALLSLAETEDFIGEPYWIAKRLGITEKIVKTALNRLVRVGFFTQNNHGQFIPKPVSLTTTQDIPNSALQRRHELNLEAAKKSLKSQSVEEREMTFITMAVDPTKIEGAKVMIREFRDKLCLYLEDGNKSEVYELAIQLYPRTVLQKSYDKT